MPGRPDRRWWRWRGARSSRGAGRAVGQLWRLATTPPASSRFFNSRTSEVARRKSSSGMPSASPEKSCSSRSVICFRKRSPVAVKAISFDRLCAGLDRAETRPSVRNSLTRAWTCWRLTLRARAMEGTVDGPSLPRLFKMLRRPDECLPWPRNSVAAIFMRKKSRATS